MFPPDTIKISGEYSHIFSNFAVPIRSCREFLERCHSKTDGLYTIYLQKPNSAETGNVFCDMTHDNGGWTLMITSASNQGWNKDNVQSRYVWNLALVCPNRLPLCSLHIFSFSQVLVISSPSSFASLLVENGAITLSLPINSVHVFCRHLCFPQL